MNLKHGDVFSHVLPGGGGWGHPFEREPAMVLDDVRNGFVTEAHARDAYGVVVDTATWSVDEDATARLRSAQVATETATVSWE